MFDLLTALLNSWSLWNKVAGSEEVGWRQKYLQLTYRAGPYRSYESIIKKAAHEAGVPDVRAEEPRPALGRTGTMAGNAASSPRLTGEGTHRRAIKRLSPYLILRSHVLG